MFQIACETENILFEKRSKFITRIKSVTREDEAKSYIEEIRKFEKGATHNCYAYRIDHDNHIIERKSDDGEPGGTAGAPMLAVLAGENMINTLVVTTRYFGGIKLGSGGLVSIYKKGVTEILKKTQKIAFERLVELELSFDIKNTHKIDYNLSKNQIKVLKREFDNQNVRYKILCREEECELYIALTK